MSGLNPHKIFNLQEFLRGAAPKTFLVGAGCSIEPAKSGKNYYGREL